MLLGGGTVVWKVGRMLGESYVYFDCFLQWNKLNLKVKNLEILYSPNQGWLTRNTHSLHQKVSKINRT